MPHPCDSHLWERHLFHCVPVCYCFHVICSPFRNPKSFFINRPADGNENSQGFVTGLLQAPGQNSWTLESSPGPDVSRMLNCLAPELREKRKRDGDDDAMDVCFHMFLVNKMQLLFLILTVEMLTFVVFLSFDRFQKMAMAILHSARSR
jgi:hypothetical protein